MTARSGRPSMPVSVAFAAVVILAAGCQSGSKHASLSANSPSPPAAATEAATPTAAASAAGSTVPDPCTLLTLPEATSLAGTTLSPGQDVPSADPASPASCTYTAPPTASSGQVELYVSLAVPRAYQIDQAVKHRFRTVPGIADQTIEEPDNNNIFIRKGQLWVYLSIPFGATPAVMERAARLIAPRMP